MTPPAKIWECIDLAQIDEAAGEMPTKDKFVGVWNTLSPTQKKVLDAAVGCTYFKQVSAKLTLKPMIIRTTLLTPNCLKAFYLATVLRLPSEAMKNLFLDSVRSSSKGKHIILEDLGRLMAADRNHLEEIASELDTTGDGKRNILRVLIAYGLQTKIVEPEVKDERGKVLSPAIYGVADGKMVHTAVKELNMMDHEYGDNDKATSSVESQSERIRRLKKITTEDAAKITKGLTQAAIRVAEQEHKQLEAPDD